MPRNPDWFGENVQLASRSAAEMRLRVRANDAERLAVLSQYDMIDTAGEPDFEMLVEVIKVQCNAAMAAIAFVDRDRMWMKASRGFRVPVIPRPHCFCSVCMHDDPPMIVEDALLDPRFRENALVVGEPGVRFYAGFPISFAGGFRAWKCLCDGYSAAAAERGADGVDGEDAGLGGGGDGGAAVGEAGRVGL